MAKVVSIENKPTVPTTTYGQGRATVRFIWNEPTAPAGGRPQITGTHTPYRGGSEIKGCGMRWPVPYGTTRHSQQPMAQTNVTEGSNDKARVSQATRTQELLTMTNEIVVSRSCNKQKRQITG